MIAGPHDIFICEECIHVCTKILVEEGNALYIPVVSKHSMLAEYLGTKRYFPASRPPNVVWQILFLAPQKEKYSRFFLEHISPLCKRYSLSMKRLAGAYNEKTGIIKTMKDIYETTLIIADISGKDPSVLYLLGMAHLMGIPLVLLTQDLEDIPAGLKKDRHILYKNTKSGLKDIEYQLGPVFEFIRNEKHIYSILPPSSRYYDSEGYINPPANPKRQKKQT
jgi:hypothetical protein